MAKFKVHPLEGTNYVDIHLANETVRVEAGALCYMVGDINIKSRIIPRLRNLFNSLLSDESMYRPTYTGTGVITLKSSFGGFHLLKLNGETWILEKGIYWASEGGVQVSYHREKLLTSLWAGEGLVYLQTRVSGHGTVAVTTRGPIEQVDLEKGQRVAADGKYVVARTPSVSFKIRKPTKNYFGRFTAGEGYLRVYEGPGRILLNPAPYWRYRLFSERGYEPDNPAHMTG